MGKFGLFRANPSPELDMGKPANAMFIAIAVGRGDAFLIPNFGIHTGTTGPPAPGNPRPEEAEILPMPIHDRLWLDDHYRLPPIPPDAW